MNSVQESRKRRTPRSAERQGRSKRVRTSPDGAHLSGRDRGSFPFESLPSELRVMTYRKYLDDLGVFRGHWLYEDLSYPYIRLSARLSSNAGKATLDLAISRPYQSPLMPLIEFSPLVRSEAVYEIHRRLADTPSEIWQDDAYSMTLRTDLEDRKNKLRPDSARSMPITKQVVRKPIRIQRMFETLASGHPYIMTPLSRESFWFKLKLRGPRQHVIHTVRIVAWRLPAVSDALDPNDAQALLARVHWYRPEQFLFTLSATGLMDCLKCTQKDFFAQSPTDLVEHIMRLPFFRTLMSERYKYIQRMGCRYIIDHDISHESRGARCVRKCMKIFHKDVAKGIEEKLRQSVTTNPPPGQYLNGGHIREVWGPTWLEDVRKNPSCAWSNDAVDAVDAGRCRTRANIGWHRGLEVEFFQKPAETNFMRIPSSGRTSPQPESRPRRILP